MNLERTWTTGPANVFGFWTRALNPSPAFWLAMFVASAFGTVLGDFWAEGLASWHRSPITTRFNRSAQQIAQVTIEEEG